MRYYDDNHMGYGGWWLMLVLMIIAIGLLTALVVIYVARSGQDRSQDRSQAGSAGRSAPTGTSAREVLDERLARGAIDPDDYRARRALLDDSP